MTPCTEIVALADSWGLRLTEERWEGFRLAASAVIARAVAEAEARAREEEREAILLLVENTKAGGLYCGGGDWGSGANTAKIEIRDAIRARAKQEGRA